MTQLTQLEAAVRAGQSVSPAELLEAQAADRMNELRSEGAAEAQIQTAAAQRQSAIATILDDVAVAADDPRIAVLHTAVVPLLRELAEREAARAAAIYTAANSLAGLGAIGNTNDFPASSFTGQLFDRRRNITYLAGTAENTVLSALREALTSGVVNAITSSNKF